MATKSNETVTVRILDKEYQVACPTEEKNALMAAADELDKRMRAVRGSGAVIGSERISVMVALNLANELLKAQRQGPSEQDQSLLVDIHERLDKVL